MAGGIAHDAILAAPELGTASSERGIARLVSFINETMFKLSALALVAAALVLTCGVAYSHLTRQGVA